MTLNLRITPAALGALQQWQLRTGQLQTRLRLGVTPGGCAGYAYTLALEPLEAPALETEIWGEVAGMTVVIQRAHQPLLAGLTLDYTEDLVGGSFRFQNPQAQRTCNCGHSFSVTTESP
ncbi:MAG: iron-sulfur cluster assembly accessory protein [Gloeomargarita sp. SKYG116]|nr:iron-sulfur cluster assembly accessory protein [Gloeomargarita sp. SKYG116]MDW8401611.1 iron-sulfur cluster assembly accessory protein [Gloeomargarita sp. SKYGB_i_bin116]